MPFISVLTDLRVREVPKIVIEAMGIDSYVALFKKKSIDSTERTPLEICPFVKKRARSVKHSLLSE